MKKLVLSALVATAVMISCTNKGQTAPGDTSDSLATDSQAVAEAVADTTPKPMFIYCHHKGQMQMVYWTSTKEPQRGKDDEEQAFKEYHDSWALQNGFRRNAAAYTNLIGDNGQIVKLRYIDELLKNPDGEEMYGGELHGNPNIPAPGLRYALANAKDKSQGWGMSVVVTDSYLATRKLVKTKNLGYDSQKRLPADVIKQLEAQYKMKADRSKLCATSDRYSYGILQFKGPWKTVERYGQQSQVALALEVFTDGDKVYSYPVEGYYEASYGPTWNADDGGEYLPSHVTLFEGPEGLEVCFIHGAPESITVGMMYVRDGQIQEERYEVYHSMGDENDPLWKKDVAKLRQLYLAYDRDAHKDYPLTKWCNIDIDGDGQNELWLRNSDNLHGALFLRQGDDFKLIAVETPQLRPAFTEQKNGIGYVNIYGTKGGNVMWQEVVGLKKSQIVERFTITDIDGDITEATLNGKSIPKWEAANHLDQLPDVRKTYDYWIEIEE